MPSLSFLLGSILNAFDGDWSAFYGQGDAVHITGLTADSRQVRPGFVFFAVSGSQADGKNFISQAMEKGAAAILQQGQSCWQIQQGIPVISVPDLVETMGAVVGQFYGNPARNLTLIGVTGTNGKSSVAYCLAHALSAMGKPCGMIGTLGCGMPGDLKDTGMTTPDVITLQKQLAHLHGQSASHVAMEVSSHALDQGRVAGLNFDVGILTNITRDHLDYHGSMAAYAQVKRQLFYKHCRHVAIINRDDPMAYAQIKALPKQLSILTYSSKDPVADILATHVHCTLSGVSIQVKTPWGEGWLQAKLVGAFNVGNLLAALATMGALGLPLSRVLAALAQVPPVPGRMQIIPGAVNQPSVVVDYAHTPDALGKALSTLRACTQGRLVCVFGCGGDRDRGKRPLMGKVAESLADDLFITDDNPRSESPEEIVRDILAGMNTGQNTCVVHDRAQAIASAIDSARGNDVVLVAGKGHEKTQKIGNKSLPFDDVQIAKACLSRVLPEV